MLYNSIIELIQPKFKCAKALIFIVKFNLNYYNSVSEDLDSNRDF